VTATVEASDTKGAAPSQQPPSLQGVQRVTERGVDFFRKLRVCVVSSDLAPPSPQVATRVDAQSATERGFLPTAAGAVGVLCRREDTQAPDGHCDGDYDGPVFLLPDLIIT